MAAAGLLRSLPNPVQSYEDDEDIPTFTEEDILPAAKPAGKIIPPYGSRKGFKPKKPEDFGDGGAYPEIHLAQYPLGMGKADNSGSGPESSIVQVTTDAQGNLNYDAIVKQGANASAKKTIHTSHDELMPKLHTISNDALQRPDDEEIEATKARTAKALGTIVDKKTAAAHQSKGSMVKNSTAPTYIKYTPSQRGEAFNSGAEHRVIRMSEVVSDPLDPPKFRHKKVPRGPEEPPVPVMHSPPRALTAKDQTDWKIPPCISNWKNNKGYTIPLDKRLAADGRGLEETQINDNFAKLTEALYVAEQKARVAVEARSKIQKELLMREKEKKEDELRMLAQRARQERAGAPAAGAKDASSNPEPGERLPGPPPLPDGRLPGRDRDRDRQDRDVDMGRGSPPPRERDRGDRRERDRDEDRETREERRERLEREQLREERKRERNRERLMEEKDGGGKKSKLTRDRERDIGERIALGQANLKASGESMYDQRLFNQDAGMESGFGGEDSYNVYDKPLFAERGSSLYKPRATDDDEEGAADKLKTDKFQPNQGFEGAGKKQGGRDKPVAFEKDAEEADPFGLEDLMADVKQGKKKR
mmetsp:Transcript_9525/g.11055  ORF Transcript_9525/g.11055 Transcript_9525/m.11055 type:complete len:590 (+) Transcript_9525:98-1867(+)|eukprot:CAMPEP_0197844986 /NCGR_PEP_ID=MMETSP1438-20131217/1945_1 /TAXON_ID=1461541 /ORGANISM="Pterosperma sp., Strain CCMP1384" /LENGTH=589 /DNA_ID=CAMNT_0043456039 /DNA_START=93 /DNA_END=1862 /DNA_ORIENTATION=+